ncbi:MAG: hypothetical protein Q8L45_13720 [Xanthomonadaceae bacterium]|nr:hypothetical protein [Xanthomonadaceae bacterium]MDP2185943.1 hypothetical protein [Xanthomonadales bacterium]MDZ4115973.1 hypothetical protein [Xanthomonadaceae bacterium]MDZ4378430.1 hypothetical protein [Xanthomonadaceae bacterium]
MKLSIIGATLALVLCGPASAADKAPDEAGAMNLLKASKCMTCHSIDKKKDGPAYSAVAEKYRDDPEAVATLTDWVSNIHPVEIDGEEEDHGVVKTKDAAKIDNLVKWILSH